jgi:SNF2 family DNA or RNA helicase
LQGANGCYYLDGTSDKWAVMHDEKLDALRSIVEEANGAPLLVAYNFKSDLARIIKAFPQARHLDQRTRTIDDWNAGKIPMLVAHAQSAGHGLNLAAGGNTLVFFGVDWNLEYRLQIVERIGPVRQQQAGLDRPVYIHNILARDTVDELVLERLESKRSVQEILLEALKRRKGS